MRVFSVGEETDSLIDFDIHCSGKICCLLRDISGNFFANLDGNKIALPDEWQDFPVGIRWRNELDCFIWGIGYPTSEHPSSVGIVNTENAYRVKLETPMLMFTSPKWVICSDSEVVVFDQMETKAPSIFNAYASADLRKLFEFGEVHDIRGGEIYFAEVEMGVIAEMHEKFWFLADNTHRLWSISLEDRGIMSHKIDLNISEVRCMACDDKYCYLITGDEGSAFAHRFSGETGAFLSSVPLETVIDGELPSIPETSYVLRGHEGSISIAAAGKVMNLPFRKDLTTAPSSLPLER